MTSVHLIKNHEDALRVIDDSIADIMYQFQEHSGKIYVVVKMGQFAYKSSFIKPNESEMESFQLLKSHLEEKKAIEVSDSVDVELLFR